MLATRPGSPICWPHGLIHSSFVPEQEIHKLWELLRTRKQLTRQQRRHILRLQKTLESASGIHARPVSWYADICSAVPLVAPVPSLLARDPRSTGATSRLDPSGSRVRLARCLSSRRFATGSSVGAAL
jgi:hypothetical protein